MSEQVTPLVPYDMYRTHAVHIGTNQKSADMQRFLDTGARDGSGLHLIDIETVSYTHLTLPTNSSV